MRNPKPASAQKIHSQQHIRTPEIHIRYDDIGVGDKQIANPQLRELVNAGADLLGSGAPDRDRSIVCQDAVRYAEFRRSFRRDRGALRASINRCGDFAAVELHRKKQQRAGQAERFERLVTSRPIRWGIAGSRLIQHYPALWHIEINIKLAQAVSAKQAIGRQEIDRRNYPETPPRYRYAIDDKTSEFDFASWR